jgi:hypothetical protein
VGRVPHAIEPARFARPTFLVHTRKASGLVLGRFVALDLLWLESELSCQVFLAETGCNTATEPRFLPLSPSRAGGNSCSLHALEVFVNLHLQLPELFQRTFGQQRKVEWILRQNLVAVGFKDALQPAHLLYGLVQLFDSVNHRRILTRPFFASGHPMA